jgi:PKD repeat protein
MRLTGVRGRKRDRDGFTLLAIIVVVAVAIALAAAVVVVNSATATEQTRIEQAQSFFTGLTTTGSGIPRFEAEIGDPPGRLSDLSLPITTAGFSLCSKDYSNGQVGSWTARYVARVFPATGTPVGIGIASDTLQYEEISSVPRGVVVIRLVPQQEAVRLDARVDTLVGAAGSSAGFVRWTSADATGLVTLRWSTTLAKKCAGANQSPTAAFTYNCTTLTCVFTDASTDPDGAVTAWSWSFGDATTSSVQNPTKVYAGIGTYTVQLTVTDDGTPTLQGSISQSVNVNNIVLAGSGRKVGGNRFADLTWTGATTVNVDVYRDGVLIVTTTNNGAYTDAVGNSTYLYKICEQGTQICSNTVSVTPP